MKMPPAIAEKMKRLACDPSTRLRGLDLFAGCGGLSLGFQAAGVDIVAAMEIDDLAARSHAINFCKGQPVEIVEHHARTRDITKIDPDELVEDFGLGRPASAIDIIIGGPPCQSYARVGRAKLREIAEHPRAFKIDPRANLYLRYLQYVDYLKPLALLMENVPDILNHGGHNIVQEMVEALDAMGYVARYSLINSAHHGVPQMRDRVFMIAFHKALNAPIRFPAAARTCILPSGYQGTRSVALKLLDSDTLAESSSLYRTRWRYLDSRSGAGSSDTSGESTHQKSDARDCDQAGCSIYPRWSHKLARCPTRTSC